MGAGGGETCEQSNSSRAQQAGEAEHTDTWPSPVPLEGGGEGLRDLSRAHPYASRMLLSFSEMSNRRQELLIQ